MEQQNPTADAPLTPTPAAAWKGKVQVEGTDLLLPSGNVARVQQLSPQAFLASGLIPDPLPAIIKKAIATKQGINPKQMEKMAEDPELLVSALELFDKVTTHVVVEPNITMPPPCRHCEEYYNNGKHENPMKSGQHAYSEGDRDPGVLYADQVDMEDKTFIFNFCLGGTRDLERFRLEHQASVESLADGEGVPVPSV